MLALNKPKRVNVRVKSIKIQSFLSYIPNYYFIGASWFKSCTPGCLKMILRQYRGNVT